MRHPNLDIIDRFFHAYRARDLDGVRRVMAQDVKWTALGRHPFGGVKNGFDEVIAFFDQMGSLMGASNTRAEKLVIGANDDFVVECQRVWTSREDGRNLDHLECVLWKFKDAKIVEGRHFYSDSEAVDNFFNYVVKVK